MRVCAIEHKTAVVVVTTSFAVFQEFPFVSRPWEKPTISIADSFSLLKATSHLTISMREQRAMGKIQRNNCHHGSCGAYLRGKTSSVPLIFTYGTKY